jgi:hypothetical protein
MSNSSRSKKNSESKIITTKIILSNEGVDSNGISPDYIEPLSDEKQNNHIDTISDEDADEVDIHENDNHENDNTENVIDSNNKKNTIKDTTKRVHTICDTEACADIEGVDLKELCDFESENYFEQMKKFVGSADPYDLKHNVKNVLSNSSNIPNNKHLTKESDESRTIMQKFENLLILKTFTRLKWLEKYSVDCKNEFTEYYKYQKMYSVNDSTAKDIHIFNSKVNNDSEAQRHDKQIELLDKALTQHKKTQELLSYELLHYNPSVKIEFTKTSQNGLLAKQIRDDITRFNPIIQSYLEDKSWVINTKDTLNFTVPKTCIVISNTIKSSDKSNNTIISHMELLMKYIERRFKVASLKYVIVRDNKYDFSWILISIGYCMNKNKNKSKN